MGASKANAIHDVMVFSSVMLANALVSATRAAYRPLRRPAYWQSPYFAAPHTNYEKPIFFSVAQVGLAPELKPTSHVEDEWHIWRACVGLRFANPTYIRFNGPMYPYLRAGSTFSNQAT